MAKTKVKIEWSLADVLKDKKISVDQFYEGMQKIDPGYSVLSLRRLIHGDIRRINFDILEIVVSLLDCKLEDLLYYGKQKPGEHFYQGDMSSLVSRSSAEEYFPIEITEEEWDAFEFLKHQAPGSAKHHVGRSVAVADVLALLNKRTTERSTYITNFFKVIKNEYVPIREDKASGRHMCFIRNSTAGEGYVSLVIMSPKAVTLLCKHSFTTLDILKNYTTFRHRQPVVTPWFEIEPLKLVYGFVDYDTQDFKRYVLKKANADIKKQMGINIDFEINKISREIAHIRFVVE